MTQLLIDIGNSFTKLAIYNDYQKIYHQNVKSLSESDIEKIRTSYPEISSAIFSCSGKVPEFLPIYLSKNISNWFELDCNLPIPIKIEYKTPDTLGKDRIAIVVGAQKLFPNNNILVIDMGTAITYEIITSEGMYIGGNISPGLDIRFKSLNYFTDKLPLLSKKNEHPFIGNNTENAIVSGVQWGIIFEIDGYINKLKTEYKELKVVLCGGNSFFFVEKLKNGIFAESDLLFIGLSKILNYNILKNTDE